MKSFPPSAFQMVLKTHALTSTRIASSESDGTYQLSDRHNTNEIDELLAPLAAYRGINITGTLRF